MEHSIEGQNPYKMNENILGESRIMKYKNIAAMKNLYDLSSQEFCNMLALYYTQIFDQSSALDPRHHKTFLTEPDFSLDAWVHRILTYSRCPREALPYGLFLLKKLKMTHPNLEINTNNCFRLFLVSVMLASKALEDVTYKNRDWVIIGSRHYPLEFLNRMEKELLSLLEWNVNISSQLFAGFVEDIVASTGTAGDKCRDINLNMSLTNTLEIGTLVQAAVR